MKKDLYPNPDPVPVKINYAGLFSMMVLFALFFFLIGIATRHYVPLGV